MKEKVVFLGTPMFSVPILEMLNEEYEVKLVVTQPDKLGKRNKLQASPVKLKALELGLEVFQPTSIKDDYQKILDTNANIMITAAYGQFIPSKLLNSFKFHLNVHGSLLPKHRGGAPIQRAIMNGDKVTGITIMEMIKKMDAGKMYAKEEVKITDEDTNETMFNKLSLVGAKLLKETLPDIICGKLDGIEQNESEATFSYNLEASEEIIDFNKNSIDIFNQVRGLAINPGAYFTFNDEKFKVYKTKVLDYQGNELPGTILSLNKEMKIKTKDGAISILEIKPAGKNILDIKSFLNGQRKFKENDII